MDKRQQGLDWRIVALAFVLTAGAYAARALSNAGTAPLLNDTDDAMRLVEIRDFLNGQGWYDLVQHRLDAPFGASIHWSRLIDAPIGLLMTVLRPFAGTLTETVAAYVWPLALLLVLMVVSARLALRLAGREAVMPGLVLPAFSLITMTEFAPGRFDHHSVQILFALLMALFMLGAIAHPRRAILAGIAAALAVAIGAESLPTAAAGVIGIGLLWVLDRRHAAAMGWFGLSFGLATAALLALAQPPERWFAQYCDAISIIYVAAALGAGLALLGLSRLRLEALWQRLAAGLALGGVLVVVLYLAFPGCFRGPYGNLDPWLLTHWLDRIDEAKPLWISIQSDFAYVAAVGVPVLLALLFVVWRLWRGPADERARWVAYGSVLLVAVLVMLLQIRGARLATSLAAPVGAAAIASARQAYLQRHRVGAMLALVFGWLGFAGLAVGLAASFVMTLLPGGNAASAGEIQANLNICRMPQSFAALAALPPGRVMAPIDLGSHILAFTPHAVVGAPYHRNADGVRDTFAFFNAPIEEAHQVLQKRGINLVVICPPMPEVAGLWDADPNSFAKLYATHQLPAWLTLESPPDATLQIYAVNS